MICVNQRDELLWRDGMTVADVLHDMHYTYPHIVVTVDGGIVSESEYRTREVPDRADVRVIHLMAGG